MSWVRIPPRAVSFFFTYVSERECYAPSLIHTCIHVFVPYLFVCTIPCFMLVVGSAENCVGGKVHVCCPPSRPLFLKFFLLPLCTDCPPLTYCMYITVRYRVQGIYAIQKPEGHRSDPSAARALHGPRVFELRRSRQTRYLTCLVHSTRV